MRVNLASLAFFNLLATTINAFTADDKRNCTGHPDPHYRNFHGLPFDFQSGCDTVLAKNGDIEIHVRTLMMGGYSAIQSIGAKVGTQVVLLEGDRALIDGVSQTDSTPLDTMGYSLELGEGNWKLNFPDVEGDKFYLIVGNFIGEGRDERGFDGDEPFRKLQNGSTSNMSFRIQGHGSLFQDSSGLCGEWNEDGDGTVNRDGITLNLPPLFPGSYWNFNGTALGNSWHVVGNDDDSTILSDATTPDPSQWDENLCVSAWTYTRRLQGVSAATSCPACDDLSNPVQQELCEYDAGIVGCAEVTYILGDIYTPEAVWFEDMGDVYESLQCLDVAARNRKRPRISKKKKGKRERNDRVLRSYGREKVKKCEELGGECVVMCNVLDDNYRCLTDLCDVEIKSDEAVDVVLLGKYYSKCACRVPV